MYSLGDDFSSLFSSSNAFVVFLTLYFEISDWLKKKTPSLHETTFEQVYFQSKEKMEKN